MYYHVTLPKTPLINRHMFSDINNKLFKGQRELKATMDKKEQEEILVKGDLEDQ